MRWKAFHYLNPVRAAEKEPLGFKAKNCPPTIEETRSFEEGMITMIQNITYKAVKCKYQQALKNDIASVKNENRLFVKANKSTNF